MIRGIVALGFAALVLTGLPVASADVVVDTKDVTATSEDGTVSAKFTVINTGRKAVDVTPTVEPTACSITPTTSRLGPRSTSVVKVTLTDCFTDTRSMVKVDLDGSGAAAPVSVSAPDKESDWAPLGWGLFAGLLLAGTVGLRGWTEHRDAQEEATAPPGTGTGPSRGQKYLAVQAIVGERMQALPDTALEWKDLGPPAYGLDAPIGNLEAGWSFKDSWVSNVTVASTAFIALLTSTEALTAVLGEEPSAALAVMTVAGLASAALIGVANTVVKLFGASVSEVTVGGLILSTAIVVFAAGFQVVTVGVSVAGVVDSTALVLGAAAMTAVVALALVAYAFRSLGQTVRTGFADDLPEVPATALSDWAATEPWEARVVAAGIRARYAKWLVLDLQRHIAFAVPGEDEWTAVSLPPAPERRRSLL